MPSATTRTVLPLLLLGTLLMTASLSLAQQSDQDRPSNGSATSNQPPSPPGGPPTAAGDLAHLTYALTLTDEQKAVILPLLEMKHTKIEALMHSSTDRAATDQEMHTIVTTTNAEIRALLTEAQQKIFDDMKPPRPPTRGDSSSQGEGATPEKGSAPPQ